MKVAGHHSILPPFQEEAARRAVERLNARSGPRRYLLADEVGLGKTHVAKRVIELLKQKLGRPPRVVYLCSSQAIVAQNRTKLEIEDDVYRAMDLARWPRRPSRVALTPGTSLRGGPGTARERALLLNLVFQALYPRRWSKSLPPISWLRFFQGGVRELDVFRDTAIVEWHEPAPRELLARLRRVWRKGTKEQPPVIRTLPVEVASFGGALQATWGRRDAMRARTARLSALRKEVQDAALAWLNPDLIILDEVQRFRDVLDECETDISPVTGLRSAAQVQEHRSHQALARTLFGPRTRVLILSATPWQALSLKGDPARHRRELRQTLVFLHRSEDEAQRTLAPIDKFAKQLVGDKTFLRRFDEQLRRAKLELEQRLQTVMSRTERAGFIGRPSQPPPAEASPVPSVREVEDLLRFGRFMREEAGAGSLAIELSKSCPKPLTFLDSSYQSFKRVKTLEVPAELVAARGRLHELSGQHHRLGALRDAVRNGVQSGWTHLWLPPRLRYYRSATADQPAPRKALVFTTWKFVPRAIAAVLSEDVEAALGLVGAELPSGHGLSLKGKKGSLDAILDTCFPSRLLAEAVDPLDAADPSRPPEVLVETARARLLAILGGEVEVVKRGGLSRWQLVARIEGREWPLPGEIQRLWRREVKRRGAQGAKLDASVLRILQRLHAWSRHQPGERLAISERELFRLAEVAAFSPAVSMRRALGRLPEHRPGTSALRRPQAAERLAAGWGADDALLAWAGLGPLRHYLGRPINRRIIERATPPGTYAARVLRYSRDHDVQAMLDEYLHLAGEADSNRHPLLALRNVLSLGTGRTYVNVRGADGRLAGRQQPVRTHMALAFGEDVLDEGGAPGDPATAFNSPFWPFVLATTSVGQEGLDFHLYCRDVVHWNLPSSPVDLEQREGRINRRQGLSIRERLAERWGERGEPLGGPLEPGGRHSPWRTVFEAFKADEEHHQTHGLHPHWLLAGDPKAGALNRHHFFLSRSADEERLALLRKRLFAYRLVFGQPDQEHLLQDLDDDLKHIGEERMRGLLPAYWVNLSPIRERYLRKLARTRGLVMLANRPLKERVLAGIQALLDEQARLRSVAPAIGRLRKRVEGWRGGVKPPQNVAEAAAVLWYLHNPFDLEFDAHEHVGLLDDVAWIREVAGRR